MLCNNATLTRVFYSFIIIMHYVVYVVILYLWLSRHETVDIVVNLLEDESTIHKRETTLFNKKCKRKFHQRHGFLTPQTQSKFSKANSAILRSAPWWRRPGCGWRYGRRPDCLCTSEWCEASACSPESRQRGGKKRWSAGSLTTDKRSCLRIYRAMRCRTQCCAMETKLN